LTVINKCKIEISNKKVAMDSNSHRTLTKNAINKFNADTFQTTRT